MNPKLLDADPREVSQVLQGVWEYKAQGGLIMGQKLMLLKL